MKKILSLLLALALLCGFGAALAEEELSGHIVMWSGWNETENNAQWLQNAMDSFHEMYPGVTFEVTWNGRKVPSIVNAALAAGQHIDIFDGNIHTSYMTNTEYLLDMTEYYDKVYPWTDGKPYKDCILPAFPAMCRSIAGSDRLYMAVYHPTAYMFLYNKDIFDDCGITETPKTWDEFIGVCEKIKEKGYIPIATDDAYAHRVFGVYLTYLKGNDYVQELVDSGLGEKWTEEPVVQAVRALEEMVQKGYYKPGQAAMPYPAVQQEMAIEGQIAIYYNGTWLPNEVAASAGEDFRWGEFAFPEIPNAEYGQNYGGYASWGLFITKECECPDAAAAFIAYLTSSELDNTYVTECNGIPVGVNGVWPENLADAKEIFESYDSWFLSGSVIETNTELLPILKDAMVRMLSGTITGDEFIAIMSGK